MTMTSSALRATLLKSKSITQANGHSSAHQKDDVIGWSTWRSTT